jgi:hypothetical protein
VAKYFKSLGIQEDAAIMIAVIALHIDMTILANMLHLMN